MDRTETTVVPTSVTARRLWHAAAPPWRAVVTLGRGEVEVGSLVPHLEGGLTPTGRPRRVRETRIAGCSSEAIRLAAEDGQRGVAYWTRVDGARSWEIQGCWCWTPPDVPRPIDVADLIALVATGEKPPAPPPVADPPPAPTRLRRVVAALPPDAALDHLRDEWRRATSATDRQAISGTAAAVVIVRDTPLATRGPDVVGDLLRMATPC